jgi:hypothetical protein
MIRELLECVSANTLDVTGKMNAKNRLRHLHIEGLLIQFISQDNFPMEYKEYPIQSTIRSRSLASIANQFIDQIHDRPILDDFSAPTAQSTRIIGKQCSLAQIPTDENQITRSGSSVERLRH